MDNAQTPRHYEVNTEIMYKLGSIEAQLAAITTQLVSIKVAQELEIANLKKDVASLKDWKALQLGAAAAISFIIGIITKVFSWPS